MITGLEEDYYCVHNPIPVNVTVAAGANETLKLNLYINGVAQLQRDAVFYTITRNGSNNTYYIDLSEWVRQFMADFEEVYTYTTTPTNRNHPYVKTVTVTFSNSTYNESVTREFVHCALDSYDINGLCCEQCCTKVWKCYPFSAPVGGWSQRVMFIPIEDEFDLDLDICENVDYDVSCCKGAYVKWLNEKGHYSYWLFTNFKTIEREGKEILRIPRNVFNPSQTSNEDTVGFDTTETLQVRDKIPKPYWSTLKSLVGSPEVYMLSPNWSGVEAVPSDWIKIIQNKPKFETETRFATAEFEMKFDLPKAYTQKRI